MIWAIAFLCVMQDISIGKASIVQSPGENSAVPLGTILIPQVQEESIPSGIKANEA